MGRLRTGTKSDLLQCLQDATSVNSNLSCPIVQVSIFDGAAIVNMLQPGTAKTFNDYATTVFIPYIISQLQNTDRLYSYIVWDMYMHDSLKTNVRSRRGRGVRRHVAPSSVIPGKWKDFLYINDNKTELFSFLAMSTAAHVKTNKQIMITHRSDVLCIKLVVGLSPCTHEEANTRTILHLKMQ